MAIPLISLLHEAAEMVLKADSNSKEEMIFCRKPAMRSKKSKKNGASDRNRTGDNHVGNVMLYQLSYTRI